MSTLILPALNLLILVGFVVYKAKHPFKEFMKTRHQGVFEGLNRSKIQAENAAKKKREVESKLANLDAEKVAILNEWKEREGQQIVAIRESSARVVTQMKKEAEQNKAGLEVSIHADILHTFKRNVVAQAETKIKQNLNADVHERLNQGFTQDVAQGAKA